MSQGTPRVFLSLTDLIIPNQSLEPPLDLDKIWRVFPKMSPKMTYPYSPRVKKALRNGDVQPLLDAYRNSCFPDYDDIQIEQGIHDAMARANHGLNHLVQTHLTPYLEQSGYPQAAELFAFPSPPSSFDLLKWLSQAAQEKKQGYTGRGYLQQQKLVQAYNRLRALELADRVIMIDQSPEVVTSLVYFNLVKERFQTIFGFTDHQALEDDVCKASWQTKLGFRMYSLIDEPFRARLKQIDEQGNLRYGSTLMKMIRWADLPDSIFDYMAVECITETERERDQVVDFFRYLKANSRLEKFRDTRKGKRLNPASGTGLNVVKFTMRFAYKNQNPSPNHAYIRIPVEIQIYTRADIEKRESDPSLQHHAYKGRQFRDILPALYPLKLYGPLLEELKRPAA